MKRQRRSEGPAAGQGWLWPEAEAHLAEALAAREGAHQGGVGGRRRPSKGREGGGGYLNARNGSELRSDPRLRELAEIGLARHWLAWAEIMGYDAFIAGWRLLSQDPALRDDDMQIDLHLRPFRSFEKYQRNRYIDTLVMAGVKPSAIRQMVRHDLGEQLTYRHVLRLTAASRAKRAIGEDRPSGPPWQAQEAGKVPE